jgi:hypothetical protein
MISLPPLGDLDNALWLALIDITERRPADWTLVGGQMVLLHALEQGVSPPRVSRDLDLVVDARVRPPAIPAMARTLDELGFVIGQIAPDGVGHRFTNGSLVIDLLAPEGVGKRADLRVGAGAATVEIKGGSYALSRSGLVEVSAAGRSGRVPRPDLAGAVLIKAMAAQSDRRRGPERHLRDLAFLLSFVPDPFVLADDLGAANRKRVRGVTALADQGDEAWALLEPARRSGAMAAYTVVTGVEVRPRQASKAPTDP